MTEPTLKIKIQTDSTQGVKGVQAVNSALGNLGKGMRSAADAIKHMGHMFSVGFGAYEVTSKLVNVTRQFDILDAGLKTATGSAYGAAEAFKAIQQFAADTPYGLQQVTEAFTKLKNYGLDPSERALTSYGNTASSLGKDLNQMIEAVADAATGEFERLKEFGIRAKNNGDTIAFTFRGITTTVKNSAAEIEQYLIKLGENNFATAMADRMNTLDGALSNLGDAWDALFLNISNNGIGDIIEDSVRLAIDALTGINDYLTSGQIEADLAAVTSSFHGFGADIETAIDITVRSIDDYFNQIGLSGQKTASFLTREFATWLQNTRSFIQIATVEAAAAVDKFREFFNSENNSMGKPGAARDAKIAAIDQTRRDSIAAILDEHNAALNTTQALIDASQKLRAEREQERNQAKQATADRLAQFKQIATGAQDAGDKQGKAADKAAKAAEQLQNRYEGAAQAMHKEIALSGNKTRATEMEWEVSRGMYQYLDDASKVRLLNLAAELDFKEKMVETSREEAEAAKAAADEYLRLYEKFNPSDIKITQNLKDVWSAADKKILSGDRLARELEKAYDVGEKAADKAADATQKAFERAIENIQDALAGMFKSVLNGEALDSFSTFANKVKDMLTSALSQAMSSGLINILSGKGTSGDWTSVGAGAVIAVGQLIGSALSKNAPSRQYSYAEQNTTPGVGTGSMKAADMFGRDLGFAFQSATVEAFNRNANQLGTVIAFAFKNAISAVTTAIADFVAPAVTAIKNLAANAISSVTGAAAGAATQATSQAASALSQAASVIGIVIGFITAGFDIARIASSKFLNDTQKAAQSLYSLSAALLPIPVIGWIAAAVTHVIGSVVDMAGNGLNMDNVSHFFGGHLGGLLAGLFQKKREPTFAMRTWTDYGGSSDASLRPQPGKNSVGYYATTPFGRTIMDVNNTKTTWQQAKDAFGPLLLAIREIDISLAKTLDKIDPRTMAYYRAKGPETVGYTRQKASDMQIANALMNRYADISNVLGKSGTGAGKAFDAWFDVLTAKFIQASKNNITQVLGIVASLSTNLESFMKLPLSLTKLIGDSVKSVRQGATVDQVGNEIMGIVNAFTLAKNGMASLGAPINSERLVTFLSNINKIGYGVQDAALNLLAYAGVLKSINSSVAGLGNQLLSTVENKFKSLKARGMDNSQITAYFSSFGLFAQFYQEAGVRFREADLDAAATHLYNLSKASQQTSKNVIDQAIAEANLSKVSRDSAIATLIKSGKLEEATVAEAEYGVSIQKSTQQLLSAMGFVQQLGFITGKSLGQMSVAASTWMAAAKNVSNVFGDMQTAMGTLDNIAKTFLSPQDYAKYNLDTVNRGLSSMAANNPELKKLNEQGVTAMLKSGTLMRNFINKMASGTGESAKVMLDYIQLLMQRKSAEQALADITGEAIPSIDGMANGIQDAIGSMRDAAKNLRDYIRGLLTSDLSTLSPEAKLQQAKSQFSSTLIRAKGGDQNAVSNLSNYANQYLEIAREYYGSSGAYGSIFNNVTGALSGFSDYLDNNANATAKAGNAALALADSFTALKRIVDGISGWTGQSSTVSSGQPLKFRASGGWTHGPTVINEDGPELVNFARPGLVTNNRQTQNIIAVGNQEAVSELRQQTEELRALVRLQQASINALLGKLDEGNAHTRDLSRKARLEAAA